MPLSVRSLPPTTPHVGRRGCWVPSRLAVLEPENGSASGPGSHPHLLGGPGLGTGCPRVSHEQADTGRQRLAPEFPARPGAVEHTDGRGLPGLTDGGASHAGSGAGPPCRPERSAPRSAPEDCVERVSARRRLGVVDATTARHSPSRWTHPRCSSRSPPRPPIEVGDRAPVLRLRPRPDAVPSGLKWSATRRRVPVLSE
jgi:hypothetical protein